MIKKMFFFLALIFSTNVLFAAQDIHEEIYDKIRGGEYAEASTLLDQNPTININWKNENGYTFLINLIDNYHLFYRDEKTYFALFKKLLNYSTINVNIQNQFGDTALLVSFLKILKYENENENTDSSLIESAAQLLARPEINLELETIDQPPKSAKKLEEKLQPNVRETIKKEVEKIKKDANEKQQQNLLQNITTNENENTDSSLIESTAQLLTRPEISPALQTTDSDPQSTKKVSEEKSQPNVNETIKSENIKKSTSSPLSILGIISLITISITGLHSGYNINKTHTRLLDENKKVEDKNKERNKEEQVPLPHQGNLWKKATLITFSEKIDSIKQLFSRKEACKVLP